MVASGNSVGQQTLIMKHAILLSVVAFFAVSCTHMQLKEGEEEWVVRAEQTHDLAFMLADAYLKFEADNADALWQISPDYKHVADNIRTYKRSFTLAHDALEAYKDMRAVTQDLEGKKDEKSARLLAVARQNQDEAKADALKHMSTVITIKNTASEYMSLGQTEMKE